jgi:hypothetical protein
MKSRSYSSSHPKLREDPKKIGLRYLEYSKINHKLLSSDPQMETEEDFSKQGKKFDYLAQLREKNKGVSPLTAQGLIARLDRKHIP